MVLLTCIWPGSGLATPAPKLPRWTTLADCAAAYQINAQVPDPDRPATMTSQISEVAGDYAAAARKQHRATQGGTEAAARQAVQSRMETQGRLFGRQPRKAVERVIDACPQPDG
jgi:hypothetical protein